MNKTSNYYALRDMVLDYGLSVIDHNLNGDVYMFIDYKDSDDINIAVYELDNEAVNLFVQRYDTDACEWKTLLDTVSLNPVRTFETILNYSALNK